jgi:hypothetical protein
MQGCMYEPRNFQPSQIAVKKKKNSQNTLTCRRDEALILSCWQVGKGRDEQRA